MTRSSHTEAATLRAVVSECARQGLDPATVLAAGGLDLADLARAEHRLSSDSVGDVWEQALRLTADPLFGLHAAEQLPFGEFGVPDFISANAPTLRAGLQRLVRYFRIITEGGTLELVERGEELLVRYKDHHEPSPITRHIVEFTLTCIVVRFRLGCGGELAPRQVWFRHDLETGLADYQRVFQSELCFGAACDTLFFDRESLDRELPGASLHLSAILERVGEEQLAQLPDPLLVTSHQVRQLLDDGFNHGADRDVDEVARRLGLSHRTLQRRLRDEGSTFQGLREEVRHELACRWLQQPRMSIGEVAFLLGFSEPSAFYRAFKRWTGQTPASFRGSP